MNNGTTALYRHYNANGALLYVGISLSAVIRFAKHKHESKWANEVHTMKVEYFDSREQALEAEQNAIKKERPLFNINHNKKPKAPDIKDCNVMIYENMRGELVMLRRKENPQVITAEYAKEIYKNSSAIFEFVKGDLCSLAPGML